MFNMEDTQNEEPMECEDTSSLFDVSRIQADKAEEGQSGASSNLLNRDEHGFNKDKTQFAVYELAEDDLVFDIRDREIGRGVSRAYFRRGYFVGYNQKVYKTAAVKRLPKSHRDEVKILAKLQHPNIISYISYLEQPHLHFLLVTEFAEFGSLKDVLKRERERSQVLDKKWLLRWGYQLVSAVQYLHGINIWHRDVKSGNCLLCSGSGSGYVLKLCDFGISLETDHDVSHITTSVGKGTPRWMAPEVIEHQRHSAASDVYSMSMVLLEMCTCKVPFSDIDIAATVTYRVVKENLTPDIPFDCPEFLKKLLPKCWSSDPIRRPMVADIKHEIVDAMPYELTKEILRDR